MNGHVCDPPGAIPPRPRAYPEAKEEERAQFWQCPDLGCRWWWKLNPTVLRWYRAP